MSVLTRFHRPTKTLLQLPKLTHRIQTLIQTQTATFATKREKKKRRPSNEPKHLPPHYFDPATTPILRDHVTHRKSIATPAIPFATRLVEKQNLATTDTETSNPPLLYDFTSLQNTMSPKLLKLFHLTNANARELAKARKARAIQLFQLREGDTGSSPAQIVALTARIQQMQAHLGTHRKDFSGKRGLDALYTKRRKMLDYLERTDFDTYRVVVKALNLVR